MGDVIPFKKRSLKDKAKQRTLCDHEFHKWTVWKVAQFHVKQGRLVTVFRCSRFGVTRTQAL